MAKNYSLSAWRLSGSDADLHLEHKQKILCRLSRGAGRDDLNWPLILMFAREVRILKGKAGKQIIRQDKPLENTVGGNEGGVLLVCIYHNQLYLF